MEQSWIIKNVRIECKYPDDTLNLRILRMFEGLFSFDVVIIMYKSNSSTLPEN